MLAASKGTAVSVAASQFTDNYAASFGGAISLDGASLAVKSSQFVNNTAGLYGGAIAQTNGATDAVTVAGSTFSGNAAGCQGGTLFFYDLDSVTVTGSAFDGSFTSLDPSTTTGVGPRSSDEAQAQSAAVGTDLQFRLRNAMLCCRHMHCSAHPGLAAVLHAQGLAAFSAEPLGRSCSGGVFSDGPPLE